MTRSSFSLSTFIIAVDKDKRLPGRGCPRLRPARPLLNNFDSYRFPTDRTDAANVSCWTDGGDRTIQYIVSEYLRGEPCASRRFPQFPTLPLA